MTLRCLLGNIDLSINVVNVYQEALGDSLEVLSDYPRVFDDYIRMSLITIRKC